MTPAGLEARMQPCLVPARSPLGQLDGVTNMVVVEGDFVGRIVLCGPGAGAGPTASAIVGDVIDMARGLGRSRPSGGRRRASRRRPRARRRGGGGLLPALPGRRRAGGAGAGGGARSAAAGISINRMRQVEHATAEAPVLIVTHRDRAGGARRARSRAIAGLEVCRAAPVAIRIEEV